MIDKLLDYEKEPGSPNALVKVCIGVIVIGGLGYLLGDELNKKESKDLEKINAPYQQERIQDKQNNYDELNNSYVKLNF